MAIKGFDYKAFALDLSNQAMELIQQPDSGVAPSNLTDQDKKNIIETVRKFCTMAGEALSNDNQIKFNAEQASLVTQFIGEWTFHKSIDLIKGKIPVQSRDGILQVIAANIFQTAKLAIIKNMPQDTIINLLEDKVKQVYADELQKLVKKGMLSPQQFDVAVNTSNLNDMVQKVEGQAPQQSQQISVSSVNSSDKRVLKLVALAMILKRLPSEKTNEILGNLEPNDVQHVLNYMKMNDIDNKIDHQVLIKAMEDIKKILPQGEGVNVPKLLKRYRRLINSTPVDILSNLAIKERENVREFILDNQKDPEETFTPMVLQALVQAIEDKINDNKKEIYKR